MRKIPLLKKLETDIVLGAEGYIFELERRGYIKAGAYVPEVIIDYPDAVKELHREFLRAGSDVMVALTYYAHREKLKAVGREGELESMNRSAVRMARDIAKEGNAYVAGNICNTWAYDHTDKERTAKIVKAQYTEQLRWATEEGIDFVLAETIEYLGEALIALEVIQSFGLPAVINLAPIYEKSKDGYDWIEACDILKKAGADVVGLNCSRGPKTMLPLMKKLRQKVTGPIACVPVPYHTTKSHPSFQFLRDAKGKSAYTLGLDQFLCTRIEMAQFAVDAKALGVSYIGICCGAGPHHVRAMAESLGRTVPASRYSPDLTQHSFLGNSKYVKKHEKQYAKNWEEKVGALPHMM
ncbi:MAG: homocysteine S-methyltransferase family protein [Candidatus Woesebacteria bacterium]